MKDFRDKVAVITGGASGIGLATATALAREGARVVLADVEEAALHKAVEGLRAKGAKAIGVRTDVGERSAVFALAGTWVFLRIVRAVPVRQLVLVPLVGIMLGGIVAAVTTFFAYRLDLLQSLSQWSQGSFAGVMKGRYELVWLAAVMMIVAWFAADRFSVIGMGEDFATSLGVSYRAVTALGMVVVAVITAAVLVTAGMLPFLGLVVPNVVSLMIGDNVRRAIPVTAALGAVFIVVCDLMARSLRQPYEIPLSVVVGIIGAGVFLWLLLRRGSRAH